MLTFARRSDVRGAGALSRETKARDKAAEAGIDRPRVPTGREVERQAVAARHGAAECKTSQRFECPCHGSQYNRVGEQKGGPAPRGMDRFGVSITSATVVVDTGLIFNGPAIGTNTTGQEAEARTSSRAVTDAGRCGDD